MGDTEIREGKQPDDISVHSIPRTTPLRERIDDLVKKWRTDQSRSDAKAYFLTYMWNSVEHDYKELVQKMEKFLPTSIKSAKPHIDIHKVYGRVKRTESIIASIERRTGRVDGQNMEDPQAIVEAIHDLAALRIITGTREQASEVHRWIPGSGCLRDLRRGKTWDMSREVGPVRGSGAPWLPEYGAYECWNHRVALEPSPPPPLEYDQPTAVGGLSTYYGVQFEIQVTSWADDLYNELAHDLLYKGYAGPLGRGQEVALDLLHGHLKSTCLILENTRIALKDSVPVATYDKLAEEMKSKMSSGLEEANRLMAQSVSASDSTEGIRYLTATLRSIVGDTIKELDHGYRRLARDLPIAEGAAFDSSRQFHEPICHPETRADLLDKIQNWVVDNTKGICWLNGQLGTGKSTISRTLATSLQHSDTCFASFFFKHGEGYQGNAERLFTTLAFQLAETIPALRPHLYKVLEEHPKIENKHFAFHFEHLIWKPFHRVDKESMPKSVVVIIDALDECRRHDWNETGRDHVHIIRLLTRLQGITSTCCKVFLTSRPEQAIYNKLYPLTRHQTGTYRELALKDDKNIKRDISIFLESSLEAIREAYNTDRCADEEDEPIAECWPSQKSLSVLVEHADDLFVYAATVCRFIDDERWHPQHQLQRILDGGAQIRHLDGMYLRVLTVLASDPDLCTQFRATVGPIILLVEPLSARSIATLLGVDLPGVRQTIKNLRSVIDLPADPGPVRILHKSFHDFLVDPRKTAGAFWIDREHTHARVARHCLSLLDSDLKRDMCSLESLGALQKDVDEARKAEGLPSAVRYACRYWVHHKAQSSTSILDGDEVHVFLRRHLLHWFEVMALLGELSDCVPMLTVLGDMTRGGSSVRKLLHDAYRFLLFFHAGVELAPLQVYAAGLALAPWNSIVRQVYTRVYSPVGELLESRPHVDDDWGSTLMTLTVHTEIVASGVKSLLYSPDGTKLAATPAATRLYQVKVWDASTGRELHVLEGSDPLAFSPDSSLIMAFPAVGIGHTHRPIIYDCETGQETYRLDGYDAHHYSQFSQSSPIVSAAFSHDMTTVIGTSATGEIRKWDLESGKMGQVLNTENILETAVSLDGPGPRRPSRPAAHEDRITRHNQLSLEGGISCETRARLSLDGTLLMTLFLEYQWRLDAMVLGIIKLWRTSVGEEILTLRYSFHAPFEGIKTAISYDNSQIAVFHGDTITLWKLDVGQLTIKWSCKTGVSSILSMVFCSTGCCIAVSTNCVRSTILRTSTGERIHEEIMAAAERVTFSPSSAISGVKIACAFHGGTIKICHLPDRCGGRSPSPVSGTTTQPNKASTASQDLTKLWNDTPLPLSLSMWSIKADIQTPGDLTWSSSAGRRRAAYAPKYSGLIRIWDDLHSNLPSSLKHQCRKDRFIDLALSADGSKVAAAEVTDGKAVLLDAETGRSLWKGSSDAKIHWDSVALSPDGSVIALGTWPGITWWELEKGWWRAGRKAETLYRLRCSLGAVHVEDSERASEAVGSFERLAFSPDGSRIAASVMSKLSGTRKHSLHIWGTAEGGHSHAIPRDGSTMLLEFDTFGTSLSTDTAAFKPESSAGRDPAGAESWRRGYSLSADRQWILRGLENVLWLPPRYRPSGAWYEVGVTSQVIGSTVIIRASEGLVIILRFLEPHGER